MKTEYRKWISRLMSAAGFILLLTVLVPHHHHEGGEVCIFMWDEEDTEEEHQSCECNGHTIAFRSPSLQQQTSEIHDLALVLIPLHTLFDYITPPLPFPDSRMRDSGHILHTESLCRLWIAAAAGFRAPPLA
jgi:hypothetical protein